MEKSQRCAVSISLTVLLAGTAGLTAFSSQIGSGITQPLSDFGEFQDIGDDVAASYANYLPTAADLESGTLDTNVSPMPTVTTFTLLPTEGDGEVLLMPEANPDALEADATPEDFESQPLSESEEVAAVIETEEFQTVAVTWPADVAEPEPMLIRVRDVDSEDWGEWIELVPDLTGPEDAISGAPETPRVGSEAVYVGASDAVEIAPISVPDDAAIPEIAEALEDIQVVLVSSEPVNDIPSVIVEDAASPIVTNAAWHPGYPSVEDLALGGVSKPRVTMAATQPNIIPRSTWGAQAPHYTNGAGCSMSSAPAVRAAVIHHTAGSNNYANQAQAMQQIRNDQAYHISMNWCDLGYNFVVDKWGNVYEGRAGSINSAVVGAHAAGFNTGTVGITMLGNYVSLEVPAAQVNATGQLAGWVLSKYGVNPTSSLSYYTQNGSSKYKAGSTVNIPAILAHRDVQATTCPGERGYAQMTAIRNAALGNYTPVTAAATPGSPYGVFDAAIGYADSIRVIGWAVDPDTGDPILVKAYVDGSVAGSAKADLPSDAAKKATGRESDTYGYNFKFSASQGSHNVCVYGVNMPGSAPHVKIACKTVVVESHQPVGALNMAEGSPGIIHVAGWAHDQDVDDPILVKVYLDGKVWSASRANLWTGVANDGFDFSFDSPNGPHNVCLFGVNMPGSAPHVKLGCKSVTVENHNPVGALDSAEGFADSVHVSGWARDVDVPTPILVKAYVDGKAIATSRADVSGNGFDFTFPAPTGGYNLCIYGVNMPGSAPHIKLGCKMVYVGVPVPAPVPAPAPAPVAPAAPSSPSPTGTAKAASISDGILGASQVSAATMAKYVLANNANPSLGVSVEKLAQLYLDEGKRLGIRGDIAFSQAIKETGWFKYGNQVKSSQNNYAGIGATTGGTPATFATPADGVRAHIEHLYAYASKNALPGNVKPIDPRFGLVTRGIAPRWQDLNGRWAVPGTTYSQGIIERYNDLVGYANRK